MFRIKLGLSGVLDCRTGWHATPSSAIERASAYKWQSRAMLGYQGLYATMGRQKGGPQFINGETERCREAWSFIPGWGGSIIDALSMQVDAPPPALLRAGVLLEGE